MPKINWKLQIDYFQPLELGDLDLFAPPGEVYRVARSYNTALALYVEGKKEEAMAALAQISADYPLFPQASHLYGVLKAQEGDFLEAETILGRVRLLELADDQRRQIEEEYAAVSREAARIQRENAKFLRREAALNPVKRQIALESILTQAPHLDDEEIVTEGGGRKIHWEDPQEKRKTFTILAVLLGIAVCILLLFFLFWRPQIRRQQAIQRERIEKLEWLEKALEEKALENREIAEILAAYQAWLEAGRPARVAPADMGGESTDLENNLVPENSITEESEE